MNTTQFDLLAFPLKFQRVAFFLLGCHVLRHPIIRNMKLVLNFLKFGHPVLQHNMQLVAPRCGRVLNKATV